MRIVTVTTLILSAFGLLRAAEPAHPLAPTEVTRKKAPGVLGELAGELSKKSGIPVAVAPGLLKAKCDLGFKNVPFWDALQQAAEGSGGRVLLLDGGHKVELVPRGPSREVATTSGAFRVVAHQVVGRARLDLGVTTHEVHLLVNWEPRLRVYRIDSAPKIGKATDVPGSKITADGGGTQVLPLDATSEMKVRLNGLTRASDRITELAGVFTVTAAESMLAFTFDAPGGKLPAPGKLPPGQKDGGVTASLRRVQKKDDTWEIAVEVTYPPNQPAFESNQGEWWLRDNRLTVRSPNGMSFAIEDYETPMPDNPHPLAVVYRFKEDPRTGLGDPTRKGWTIVYETPAPLVEVEVPFALKDIPLP